MDQKLSALTARGTPDRAVDQLYIINGNNEYRTTVNNMLGIASQPVGLTENQTLTNKTLTAPTINSPVFGGTLTGTYTIGGTVTFPASIVTLTGTQTLTNKTLTSPTINTPTITNASITADAINGFTTANNGTIYGLSISAGLLTANTVPTVALQAASVTGPKINWAGTGASSGIWWEELGRTTLAVAGDTILVSSLPARKYLEIWCNLVGSGAVAPSLRFNGDTGNNYAYRYFADGTAGAAVSQARVGTIGPTADSIQATITVGNIAATKKNGRIISASAGASAAANTGYTDFAFTWHNSAAAISSVTIYNDGGAGDFAIGSEVVVLGHD
jgi:hypothetical protein